MSIENVKCPQCDGPMTSRKNSATGQRFWGCNAYPQCKGTLNTDGDEAGSRWRSDARWRNDDVGEMEPLSPSERAQVNDKRRW